MEFTISGKEMLKKAVGKGGNAGIVYLPKEWIGENVAVIRLEEDD